MPYPSYAKLTDEDVQALYAFFMQSASPAAKPNKPSEIPWPLNIRWPFSLWNSLFTEAATFIEQPARVAQWNRGAFQGAGHPAISEPTDSDSRY